MLFKDEPVKPPRTPYELFLKEYLSVATDVPQQQRMRKCPGVWNNLSPQEQKRYEDTLEEVKTKYMKDYTAFISQLSMDELEMYHNNNIGGKEEAKAGSKRRRGGGGDRHNNGDSSSLSDGSEYLFD
jgi:hypothetical protein